MTSEQSGYGNLRVLEEAVRTKKLQRIICEFLDGGGNLEAADRTALLGLMTIVGELEYGLREVIGEVFPKPDPDTQ